MPADFLSALRPYLPPQTSETSESPNAIILRLPQGAAPGQIASQLPTCIGAWSLCHTQTETVKEKWARCFFFREHTAATGFDILRVDLLSHEAKACEGHAQRSRGIMIAFQGTDGSGKSTVINGLYQALADCFPEEQMVYYHCRPFLFQPAKASHGLNMDVVCPDPHGSKPYGRFISLGKLAYCSADYIIGYLLKVRQELKQGKLVIFDRYYYDFYLDKLRYRLKLSDFWIRLFEPFIPKPDITFVLTGEAEPIWQRKQEIPLEEVREQIRRMEYHSTHFAHAQAIDVVRSIPEVVGSVTLAVLRALHRAVR